MSNYIDRDKIPFRTIEVTGQCGNTIVTDFVEVAYKSDILAAPAADVRPVVLCRDCKHNMANIPDIQDGMNINENWNACQLTELYDSVKPDDFCSRGIKREES